MLRVAFGIVIVFIPLLVGAQDVAEYRQENGTLIRRMIFSTPNEALVRLATAVGQRRVAPTSGFVSVASTATGNGVLADLTSLDSRVTLVQMLRDPAPVTVASDAAIVAMSSTSASTNSAMSMSVQSMDSALVVNSVLTPATTIASFVALQKLLDHALDRVDAIATSQLFAARSHVAATVADLDATFRFNMNATFDKLTQQQQTILTQANVLLHQTTEALVALERDGFDSASDLVCQSTIALANFKVLPRREPRPDVLCLSNGRVSDAGPFHDQLLSFRGINLRPSGGYPKVKLLVPSADQELNLIAAGGNTVLQVALPGGINGKPDDTTMRGNLIVRADIDWSESSEKKWTPQRWMFVLRPYVVSTVNVVITPKVRQATLRTRSQSFYVDAPRGEERNATWTMVKSLDAATVTSCTYVETNKVSNSGLTSSVLQTPGSCQVTAVARGASGGVFGGGGGGSYGVLMTMTERVDQEVAGPTYTAMRRINQGSPTVMVPYDPSLIPSGSQVIDWAYSWRADVIQNTGRQFLLTNTQQSQPGVGIASMSNAGELTVTMH